MTDKRRTRAEPGDAEPAGAEDVGQRWLVLIYRLPSEPTRLRATVWRRLRSLGAIYLQSGTAALPDDTNAERSLRKLRREIVDMSGTCILLRCRTLAGETELLDTFQAARHDEYEEIIDKCRDFMAQLDKEYAAEHFTVAELEENEVDLVKLQNWMARVRERDVFGAAQRAEAEEQLTECEAALERYANRVFELDLDAN